MHTADSIVSKCVAWLHEVVYSAAGKPAVYDEISMALFVHGYLIEMEGERESVKAKMATHLQNSWHIQNSMVVTG